MPPVPGFAIDTSGIDLFGAIGGFVWAEVGIMVGAAMAFGLARTARRLTIVEQLEEASVHLRIIRVFDLDGTFQSQFWRWFVIRLLTNPLFDALSYASGFTSTRFKPYALASFLGNVPSMAIFYFLNRNAPASQLWTLSVRTSLFLIVALAITALFVEHLAKVVETPARDSR